MTVQCLVLTFTREGFEIRTLYHKRFFETYTGLKRWHDNERRGWLRGHVETRTLTGRRRMDVQKLTDRLNAPVQGTGADGLKLALALLWEQRTECPGAVPVLVCHDEVVLECPKEDTRGVAPWLKAKMGEAMEEIMGKELSGPKCAEVGYGPSWGECVDLVES